ncbi:MAG: hypothetical protein LBV70_02315 [Candidatus Adiutrix sp.]|jgi:hypothetical protein|nr:hypothetical protein [Candidatus Adiutrix sp.]
MKFEFLAALALALALAGLLPAPGPARAATLAEIFLLLPANECGGYDQAQRQDLLAKLTQPPDETKPGSEMDASSPKLRQPSENFLVLQRPQAGAITYKLFEGRSFQLMVVCRGRQRPAPGDPANRLDLSLYIFDRMGLNRADLNDYLPGIGILDFVTADTVTDPRAVRGLARLAPAYAECLSCSLNADHQLTLDIVTATSLNAAPCGDFLPAFGRLPLTWNGQIFTKPYDRAAPREEDLNRRRPLAENNPASPGQ